MTNNDKTVDDLAHERFKADFKKLFGVKPEMRKSGVVVEEQRRRNLERLFPTPALRKEYAASDEGGRMLMLLEVALEAMAEPQRMEKRAALAKALAEGAALRAQAQSLIAEFNALQAEVERLKKRRDEAQARAFRLRPFALDVNDCHAVGVTAKTH